MTQPTTQIKSLKELVDFEQKYHHRRELSNSGVKLLRRSFAYYKHCASVTTKTNKEYFQIGTAFDMCMCLGTTDMLRYMSKKTPTENVMKLIAVIHKYPNDPFAANEEVKAYVKGEEAAKKFFAVDVQEYLEELHTLNNDPNIIALSKDNYDLVKKLYEEATNNNFYLAYIKNNPSVEYQKVLTWTEILATGEKVRFRGMLDIVFEFDNVIHIVDLKTTSEPNDLSISIRKYGYADQLAGYVSGMEALYPGRRVEAYLMFVNVTAPYEVTVYNLSQEALRFGKERTHDVLNKNRQHFNSEGYLDFETINTKPLFEVI
jgi:hypothetical protein